MTKQLLIETFDFTPESVVMEDVEAAGAGGLVLAEDARPAKRMVLEGVFQRSDTPNLNKRTYPRKVWEKLCTESSPMMGRVKNRAMVGHLEHPKDGATDLSQGAILVTDVKLKEDGVVWGRCLVYNTPAGRMVQEYVETGTKLGISSRGTGSVDSKGVVQEDYDCNTWDIVFNPSTPGANPKPANETEENPVTKNQQTESTANEGLQSIEQQLLISGPEWVGAKTGLKDNNLAMVFGRFLSYATQMGAAHKTIEASWAEFIKMYPTVLGASGTAAAPAGTAVADKSDIKVVAPPANQVPDAKTIPTKESAEGDAAKPADAPAALDAAAAKPGQLDEQGVALLAEARAQVATLTESLSKKTAELETSAALVSSLNEDKNRLQAAVDKGVVRCAALESTLAALTAVNVAEQVREAVGAAIKADPRLAAFRETLDSMKTPAAVEARAQKLVQTLSESAVGTKPVATPPVGGSLEDRVRRRQVVEAKGLPAAPAKILSSENDAGTVNESATHPAHKGAASVAAALKKGIFK